MRSFVYKSIVSLILISTLVISDYANAQAQVVVAGYTARLNLAIGRVVTAKMARWGIAANDPRVAATVKGIETGLTVVAGVGMVGGTAISWPALLTAGGLAALAGGGLKLATDKNFTWNFLDGGVVNAAGSTPGVNAPLVAPPHTSTKAVPPMLQGNIVGYISYDTWNADTATYSNHKVYSTDMFMLGNVAGKQRYGNNAFVRSCNGYPMGSGERPDVDPGRTNSCSIDIGPGPSATIYINTAPAPASSANGTFDARQPPPPIVVNATYPGVKEAAAAIPEGIKGDLLSPEAIAATVNAAWKLATDPNVTGGVPWSASDPITPGDASAWANPSNESALLVSDFSAPANHYSGSSGVSIASPPRPSSGGGSTGTSPTPGTGTSPTPGTGGETGTVPVPETTAPVTPGQGEKIDWGPNPNIGAPSLETVPTASSILDPIFNVMPDLKNFGVPNHASVCPTAGFTLYGNPYLIDVHCSLFDQNRQVIAACAVLCFTLASLFIVLRA